MTDREFLQRWMDGQEEAIRHLTVRLDAVEGQVGTMAAKIDRFDQLSDKLDDLANSMEVVHRAAEIVTRGWRFWAKVAIFVSGVLTVARAVGDVVLPVLRGLL